MLAKCVSHFSARNQRSDACEVGVHDSVLFHGGTDRANCRVGGLPTFGGLQRRQKIQPLAKRFDTLNGKTIAQLWDYLFQGDEVFDELESEIRKVYPDVKFVSWREFGNTHTTNEKELLASLPQRFKELGVDAAISGMAC